jgi:hypothetical protein
MIAVVYRAFLIMLKSLLRSIYFLIMGPLYKRLQRELTLENQALKEELLRLEERFTIRVMNETVRIVSILQHKSESAEFHPVETSCASTEHLGENQIGYIMQSLMQSRDILKVSRDAQISIPELLNLQKFYGGMDGTGVKRVRQLEAENVDLKQTLLQYRLQIESLESELATIRTPGIVNNMRVS